MAWRAGDEGALSRLMPLVYNELHRLARRYMAVEQTGHPLQTTGLVHETYLRLVNANTIDWQNRAHFYAICARLMRQILIDFARSRNYQKRGPGFAHIQLEDAVTAPEVATSEVLAVDEALKQLAAIDARKSEVVELRFFGGLTFEGRRPRRFGDAGDDLCPNRSHSRSPASAAGYSSASCGAVRLFPTDRFSPCRSWSER